MIYDRFDATYSERRAWLDSSIQHPEPTERARPPRASDAALVARWMFERFASAGQRFRRFVDLGCGTGDWAARFARRTDQVFACDTSLALADQTRTRLEAMGHRATYVVHADVRDYLVPRKFDLAVLGHLTGALDDDDLVHVFRRLRAAAAPDARIVVIDRCAFNLGRARKHDGSVTRRGSAMVELAVSAGLRCEVARSAPSIRGERALGWLGRFAWRVGTVYRTAAEHVFVLEP